MKLKKMFGLKSGKELNICDEFEWISSISINQQDLYLNGRPFIVVKMNKMNWTISKMNNSTLVENCWCANIAGRYQSDKINIFIDKLMNLNDNL